jgi:hypothetical protein
MRTLLVTACAVMALSLACVSGQLRGAGAPGHAAPSLDSIEALLPESVGEGQLLPPPLPSGTGVFLDLRFPPSRMTTAEVFRPPQARS